MKVQLLGDALLSSYAQGLMLKKVDEGMVEIILCQMRSKNIRASIKAPKLSHDLNFTKGSEHLEQVCKMLESRGAYIQWCHTQCQIIGFTLGRMHAKSAFSQFDKFIEAIDKSHQYETVNKLMQRLHHIGLVADFELIFLFTTLLEIESVCDRNNMITRLLHCLQ